MQGTWKTTSGGIGDVIKAGAVIGAIILVASGALAGAVAAAVSFLEMLLFCALALLALATVAAFLLWRKYGHRPPPVREQITAFHEAQQVRVARQRPAIAAPAQHWHVHFHGTAAPPEGVPAALKAITESQQGDQS
jgi:membrane protein implicated in regulation of membrane protease activity